MTIRETGIAQLRHRIVLCTMQDVVEKDGRMHLTRKEVVETWARVRPFVTFASQRSSSLRARSPAKKSRSPSRASPAVAA